MGQPGALPAPSNAHASTQPAARLRSGVPGDEREVKGSTSPHLPQLA